MYTSFLLRLYVKKLIVGKIFQEKSLYLNRMIIYFDQNHAEINKM